MGFGPDGQRPNEFSIGHARDSFPWRPLYGRSAPYMQAQRQTTRILLHECGTFPLANKSKGAWRVVPPGTRCPYGAISVLCSRVRVNIGALNRNGSFECHPHRAEGRKLEGQTKKREF